MDLASWLATLPTSLSGDPLWRLQVYRLSLYSAHVGWEHTRALANCRCMTGVASQLIRAVGSIGANIAEGYSRGTGADRTRFYEYALGSARESRHWYWVARPALPEEVVGTRLELLASISRLLLATLPYQRCKVVRRTLI